LKDLAWRSSLRDLIVHLQLHRFKFRLSALESVLVDTSPEGRDIKCMAKVEIQVENNSSFGDKEW
jgi:hypothetical protein